MRKFALTGLIAACAIFLGATISLAGRLNFMLINHTGHDIVDVKIYPTYYPKYVSENLIKTALDPQSRIYIGPNYYGDQKYWSIALKWANGYEQTFPKLALTRYNTYTVYSTPEGLKMRQTFEKDAARYEFGPDAPSYMGAEPDVKVNASAPEKIAVQQPAAVQTVEPGKVQPTPRNLTFADTQAAKDAANTLALKTTVEMTRDGKTNTVSPNGDFKAGDKVKLLFSSNKDGHIYWVAKDNDGQYQILFPQPGTDNTVSRNKEYSVPTKDPLQFDENQGTETIFAILSPKAVPTLDKAVELIAQGKQAEASKLVSEVVNGHEQKREAHDLVFEEEDADDVNTQSQLADGENYLIGTYELSHN